MRIETEFAMNAVILVNMLPRGEAGASRRLADDLSVLSQQSPSFLFRYEEIVDDAGLRKLLLDLRRECRRGLRPIIHFDGHGDSKRGMQIGRSSNFFSWAELAKKLRKINMASGNNLCVVMGVCSGLDLIRPISILKPVPFYTLIAPRREVSTGYLDERVSPFYRALLGSRTLDEALQLFLPELAYFHAEKMFLIVMARHIAEHCVGKGVRIRRERLLSEVIENGIANNPRNRRLLRKSLKQQIRPSQVLIDHFSNKFLLGRQCNVSIEMILNELGLPSDAAQENPDRQDRR
ncbi:hypothetical protein [Tahibacter sp.]|uniref:hypothetical protein n=1 Tax=Tahibacter sp. TaxID=2056211 RepID=UPI0028C38065|nr:hypothetical protein [Tahibacter sp.]